MTERDDATPGGPTTPNGVDVDERTVAVEGADEPELEGMSGGGADDLDDELDEDLAVDDADGVDAEAELVEEEADEADLEAASAPGTIVRAPGRPSRLRRRGIGRPAAAPAALPRPSEAAVQIDDRVSQAFVIAVVATFAAIFAYGLLFGQAGFFTPLPTHKPAATLGASPSPGPSGAAATPAPSAS